MTIGASMSPGTSAAFTQQPTCENRRRLHGNGHNEYGCATTLISICCFAGLTAALGAVTAFAFATIGLHSRRNLALYLSALLFVVALATAGINGWFYVGNYGVPWYDRPPVLVHRPVTSMFLVLAIITALIAGWLHFRIDYAGHTEVANTRRNRLLASTPLLAVALIMVLLSVGSMAKALP